MTYTADFESYVKFVLNNKSLESANLPVPVLDRRTNQHTIGAEYDGFHGFIYSLSIYSFANPTYSV